MQPRQARRERREAERKAKKLELKKNRLAEKYPLAAVDEFPEIQPRWNPELEDEFPREVQIRNNAMADRIALKAGLPIPPPGPSPTFNSLDDIREHLQARRKALGKSDSVTHAEAPETQLPGLPEPPTTPPPFVGAGHVRPARPEQLLGTPTDIGFVSQNKPSRAETNRANAQKSTGPRSPIGKLASSGNSFKHGLASGQLIIPGEDPAQFESLLRDLMNDHQPAETTEALLVTQMAQSHWLQQRAIRLQNNCFTDDGVDQKGLALFLRYGTTHHRAFFKALGDLQRLQKDRRKVERGFVSQNKVQTAASVSVSQIPIPSYPQEQSVQQNAGFVSQPAPNEQLQPTQGDVKAA